MCFRFKNFDEPLVTFIAAGFVKTLRFIHVYVIIIIYFYNSIIIFILRYVKHYFNAIYNKYSFHKKLRLRLATNYSWCLLKKPLHISKADTKFFIGGFQAKMRGAGFIPYLGWNTIKMPLNQRPFIYLYLAMHSAILWYRMRFCSI